MINHHVFGVVDGNGSTYGAGLEISGASLDISGANTTTTTPPTPGAKVGLTPRIYMTMLLPFIMALACVRDIRRLAYCSIFANILCITGSCGVTIGT